MKWTLLAVVLGFLMDLCFGDPRWLYHPVRIIGHGITFLEKILRKIFPKTKTGERIAGGLLVVGIGNNRFRAQVYEKAKALGYAFPNIIAPSAYISPYAKLGCGCVILQNACVQNGASVGDGVLLNAGTEVHCDATLGDYALIYTNSVVRTGATVGNFTRIGSNCTICNNATVPDGADISDCTAVH